MAATTVSTTSATAQAVVTNATPVAASAPTKMVRVVNNTTSMLGIQCNDANIYLHLTRNIKGKESHISKPVDINDLPVSVTKKQGMLARGEVSLIDA